MDPTPPETVITQKKLAAELGLSVVDVKKLRADLIEGEDWRYTPHTTFTAAGMAKILAKLGLPPAWQPGQPVRVSLTVVRLPKNNTRLLYCKTGDDRYVTLLVKNNALFTRGMTVSPCVRHPDRTDVYHFEGKLPRLKGRH